MKSNNIIMYPIDNQLFIYKNDKCIKESFNNDILLYGKIQKPNLFLKRLIDLLKKEKLSSHLSQPTVFFIINPTYTQADIAITNNILDNLGNYKIKIIKETKLLKFKSQYLWITVNNTHLYFFVNKPNKKHTILNFKYELFANKFDKLVRHLKIFIKNKKIILLGSNSNIELVKEKFEKLNIKTYILENPDTFIIEQLKSTL